MPSPSQKPTGPVGNPRPGPGLVRVTGRSMRPTLDDGDLLLVRWGARPSVGDLVVARLPGGRPLAVKRVTSRQDGGWWLERDNPAEGVDSWVVGAVAPGDVLAVVAARIWPRPARRRLRPGTSGGPDRHRPEQV